MRVRFPYTARYDSMPVGSSRRVSHDHAGRVRWSTSPFVRRTRGPSPAPIILWVDDSHQPSVGRVGANPIKPIRPVRERFPGTRATAFLVSRTTGLWERSRWEHGRHSPCSLSCLMPQYARPPQAWVQGSGTKRPDRSWTARAYPCGLFAQCFRSPTGRDDSLRNCPVRVRIPAKAPAETRASTPPIRVLNACLFRERCIARPSHNWGR